MSDLPSGFLVDGIYCLSYNKNSRILCIPGAPTIATGRDGKPKASLVQLPDGTQVSIECEWRISEHQKQAIRQEVSGQAAENNHTSVEVAALSQVRATLQIKENDDWLTFGPQSTSGLGAYGSVFSVALSKAAASSVRNALRGQTGWLRLGYTAELNVEAQALVEIEGDIGPAIKALAPPAPKRGLFNRRKQPESPNLQSAKEQVQAAIQTGQLTQTISLDGPMPDEAVQTLKAEVEETIAEQVLKKTLNLGENAQWVSTINVQHSQSGNHMESHNIKREADWCSRE